MAKWEEVSRIANALPETIEQEAMGTLQWRVRGKAYLWERPLRRADYESLGDAAPDGPILGVRVSDLGVKEALISDSPDIYFTTPHFDGYPAILVRLEEIPVQELEEIVIEAWLVQAPKRLAREYLKELE